ncbi:MAG: hypothetical protein ACFE0I_21395 [Elainellaceae cyanobacterium]
MPKGSQIDSEFSTNVDEPTPIFVQKVVERCHIILPGISRPVSAIIYENQYYGYVKFFRTAESAQRGASRLKTKGNRVLLTRVPKGLVLWVFEPDAHRARKC